MRPPARSTQMHHRTVSMPFIDRLTAQQRSHSPTISESEDEMGFFQSSTFLTAPTNSTRKRSDFPTPQDESDLETSFASNVSLNSPPRHLSSLPDAMDISPAPARLQSKSRPRALTTGGSRLFGSDISNGSQSPLLPSPELANKSSETLNAKRTQRSALPLEWLASPSRSESEPHAPHEPSSPMDDAMDVDTSYIQSPPRVSLSYSPDRPTASPTANQFNELFFEVSPRRSLDSPSHHNGARRRSLSPDAVRSLHLESSPLLPSSPSDAKLDRMRNGGATRVKPSLQGLGAPAAAFLKKSHRPSLSAMVGPADQIQSAYPSLSPTRFGDDLDASPSGPPFRRAFSAFLPPATYIEADEEDTSFEGLDLSSPAQAYTHRQQNKSLRRRDGTEDFKPMTFIPPRDSPSSRFLSPGLPGFAECEATGKVLPCHRVTEDGLMRIKPETLNNLIDGHFDEFITSFHIIDCRFDYEYTGGHIDGAVNINTTAAIEELLLGPSLMKPKPSSSGDKQKKTVLVFHCEFSAKRAPTFAKHLRSKDRSMNHHVYPKVHYPEVYILEGGYCAYYKASSQRCRPQAYVTMDDPNHASSRREDLDQFRKARFGRHKSYAFGEGPGKSSLSQQPQQTRRATAPGAPQNLFSAAAAARTRRSGGSGSLTTLSEDIRQLDDDDTDTDINDSPCPPQTKATAFKSSKKPIPRPILRSETYGPSRMPL